MSIVLTNSIFKAMIECPARAMAMYSSRIKGDTTIEATWKQKSTAAMACGSLVDAMVTRGFDCSADDKSITPIRFFKHLASSYDDGMKNAELLCNKSGGWNADAVKAIQAGKRLLADKGVQELLKDAILQPRIKFKVEEGVYWEGDIDILTTDNNGNLLVVDLKSPGSTEDGWLTSMGKNVKVPWYDAWSYWFQLSGYCYGLQFGKELTLNGEAWKLSKDFMPKLSTEPSVYSQILFGTREPVCQIGLKNIANMPDLWHSILTKKTKFGGPSKLDAIRAIVSGEAEAPMCGKCDYCKSKSFVAQSDEIPAMPVIDDIYGVNDIE